MVEDLDLVIENGSTVSTKEVQPVLKIKYLGDIFYAGTRNELTPARLKELSVLAQTIPEPKLFGTYLNDRHYIQTLDLMLGSTEETRHRGMFFIKMVLPKLVCKNKLLEIGPGNGKLISWIGNKFKYITAIDINKDIIENLNTNKKILRKSIHLEKVLGSVADQELNSNFYDLILLSHVLYYISYANWLKIVVCAYDKLKRGGILAIVLSGDKFGKADLIKYYGGKLINIDSLAKQCNEQFGAENVEIFASKEIIITKDLKTMLHIAGFFLYDAYVTATKDSLTDYINENCNIHYDRFEMTTQQKFILIHKRI